MSHSNKNYKQLHSFFDGYALAQASSRLSGCIEAADSAKTWKGDSPAELLWFIESFEKLLNVAFRLTEDKAFKEQAILDDNENLWLLNKRETFCGRHALSTPWDFFPRHLTCREFLNPYKALQKITKFQTEEKWKDCLKDVLQHALSPNDFHEFDHGVSLLRIYLLTHKLLEACHLIEVRTYTEGKTKSALKAKEEKQDNSSQSKKEKEVEEEPNDETRAWSVIAEFFLFFREGTAEELWAMTKRSLTNDQDQTSAHDRSNMIFLYEHLKELVEAVFILHEIKNNKT